MRTMTVTSDREKYGVHLCAEPDHSVLGARLKGAFKSVMAAVKALSDAELRQFQKDGKMTVLGHVLTPADVCLKYTLDASSSSTPSCYNAHSENEVGFVWRNVTLLTNYTRHKLIKPENFPTMQIVYEIYCSWLQASKC